MKKTVIIIFICILSFYAVAYAQERAEQTPVAPAQEIPPPIERRKAKGEIPIPFDTTSYTQDKPSFPRFSGGDSFGDVPPSLFADLKASRVGDIVIVLVMESASAKRKAATKTNKSSKRGVQSSFNPVKGELSSESLMNGSGSTSRSGEITAKVAAMVTSVLPNGNLLLEGKRELIINKDKETISVRGIVRLKDITSANTVLSTQLADAQIQYEGDGFIAKQQRPGLLLRILDWLWIF